MINNELFCDQKIVTQVYTVYTTGDYAVKHANYKDLSHKKMNIENRYALLTSNPTKSKRKKVLRSGKYSQNLQSSSYSYTLNKFLNYLT